MNTYKFSGHETFVCKQFWLKKGYDFVKNGKLFTDDSAVIELGVGKNMVISIRFWMKAFGLIDENDQITNIAKYIFSDEGVDPYIEDIGTIWLLHYYLIKIKKASIYSLFFNEFRKERYEFTKEQLNSFLKRKIFDINHSTSYNTRTIDKDIEVLLRSYLKPDLSENKSDIENDFARLLIDLDILNQVREKSESKTIKWFKVEGTNRNNLPIQFVLFSILDNLDYGEIVSFKDLLSSPNSPGLVFILNKEGLYDKIQQITEKFPTMVFSETAGNQVLKIDRKLDKWTILDEYYK